ncbi:ABC transporter permease [Nocardia implantans]|uniref:ABC transporter permease n=1 Tax=Nocardia implantans TaxID=3108168 RepID=A0ABU6AY47_9NOCA|nr:MULTISPECIES: ABC transporter permease [unclassified Nocardia]MBF6190523.1 ABC transporter permease [Nocardia beijingensis]MEA3528433.1 ABC transporter permease [Nocardia sp. CDC192]MEB3512415.1 ABC transporter permease [Nocardia sp. CDC186]
MRRTGKGGGDSRHSALLRYLGVRLLLIPVTALILVTVVFFLMRVVGDPISAAMGGRMTQEQIEARKEAAGLNRPILTQYGDYLSGLLHGDLGRSQDNREISEVVVTYGAASLELVCWALVVAFAIGVPLGRYAATRRDSPADTTLRLLAILFYAAPVFFVGLLLKLVFAVRLGWLPVAGRASTNVELRLQHVSPKTNIMVIDAMLYGDAGYLIDVLKHAVLPAIALGLLTAGIFLRLVRINLIQTLRADYVDAARARGLSRRVVTGRHAFRNALIPIVTVMGMQIAMMLGASVLTETTFEWKGLGYQFAQYLSARDFIAVQGIVAFIALIVAVMSFLVDVLVALIDPRVRF